MHGRGRASGPLGDERRCPGEGCLDYFGIDSPFKPERGIGGQAVALGHFSRHDRIEVGRLEEYPGRRLRNAACVTAKHTGQAHGFVGVCDDLVVCMEGAFLSIERRQFLTEMGMPNHDRVAFNGIRVEGMQRLAHFVQHVIRGVHNVVLGVDANRPQSLLNRIGRRTNANAFNQQSEVAGASIAGFNGQFEGPLGRR